MASWEQTINKGDIVRDLDTGQYEVIEEIQWEHNRYQFKWRSNWRYGTDRIEKVEPFDFIEFANGLKRIVEQQQQEIENYKFALSKIMNTHSFISQGKMQYTATGEIAKKALDKNLVNTR